MRNPSDRPATYDDLAALPSNMVGQIIEGVLYAHPRPASDHAVASSGLGSVLTNSFQFGRGGPGGWWIIDEPELKLRRDILVPDIAGWRTERMPRVPRVPRFELASDWVCEILSPSTVAVDRVLKKHVYAREGVEFLWYLDPRARVLEAFALRGGQWVEQGSWSGDVSVRAPPFDAVELDLSLLWLPEEPAQEE